MQVDAIQITTKEVSSLKLSDLHVSPLLLMLLSEMAVFIK